MDHLNHTNGEFPAGEEQRETSTEQLGFFEMCYGILFQPSRTFGLMKFSPPLFYGFMVLLITNLLGSLANYLTGSPVGMEDLPPDFPREIMPLLEALQTPGFGLAAAFFGIILAVVFWVVNGGLMQIIAEFFGGKGKGLDILVVTGFSTLPTIFLIPILVLISVAGLPSAIGMVISFPLTLWSYLILPVIGIKETHQIGTGRAVATVLAPLLLFLGLIFAIIFIMVIAMLPMMAKF
ncbi:MAG: Yip1 family protein [Clostridia bacterium]|nr:Yip1 family protein [Clostridia bacterium]